VLVIFDVNKLVLISTVVYHLYQGIAKLVIHITLNVITLKITCKHCATPAYAVSVGNFVCLAFMER